MKQLTSSDEMWFSLENDRSPMHLTSVDVYDPATAPNGEVTLADVTKYVEARLDQIPSLRKKRLKVPLHLDKSYWVDDASFDLNDRIFKHTLATPGNSQQLFEKVCQLASTPLDLSQPLWELHVIEGLNKVHGFPKGCFAIAMKLHHGLFDGMSVMGMSAALNVEDPDAEVISANQEWEPEKTPSKLKLLGLSNKNRLTRGLGMGKVVIKDLVPSIPKKVRAAAKQRKKDTTKPPSTRFAASIPSNERAFVTRTFSLAEMQKIRKKVAGSTINDVALTICSGAIRRYLDAQGELPDDPLIALTPVSVRKESDTEGGNKVGQMTPNLFTNESDPVARMARIHEDTKDCKEFSDEIDMRGFIDLFDLMPQILTHGMISTSVRFRLVDRIDPMYSGISLSNVPGSRVPRYFCGARKLDQYMTSFLMDGMGIMHGVSSYCDNFTFSVTSTPEFLPDPDFYGECLQEAFDELAA